MLFWIIVAIVIFALVVAIERTLPRPDPGVAAALLFVTLTYLGVELAFNARLLDVAGRPGEIEAIGGIEQWGRIISGAAVALAVWGLLAQFATKLDWPPVGTIAAMVVSAVLIVPAVYNIEKFSVDKQVNDATPEIRQVGALGVLVTRYLHRYRRLEGLPLSAETLERPEGKAFYALFPSFYSSVLRNVGELEPIAETTVRDAVARQLGSPARSYRDYYIPAIEAVRQSYDDQFVPAATAYADAIDSAPQRANAAWSQYVASLQSRGWSPERVPWYARRSVRRRVREEYNIDVPDDWPLDDYVTFYNAVTRQVYNTADAEWRRRSTDVLGEPLPRDIETFSQFVALAPVQRHLRSELNMPVGAPFVSSRWTLEEWDRYWHTPTVRQTIQNLLTALTRETSSFLPGGDNFCRGENAVRALSVPAFALSISMMGAFYHASKVVWYLCYILPGLHHWFARWPIRLTFVALVVVAPIRLAQSHEIVGTQTYRLLIEHKKNDGGQGQAFLFDWIIRAEQLYYPLSSSIRTGVLGGFEFAPFETPEVCGDPSA